MKYRTIVADPPWPIGDFPKWGDQDGTTPCPYPTMELAQISALPVREMADSDAHLYLWTTTEFLCEAHDISRAWGFTPTSVLVWCKPSLGLGLGGLFPSNVEFIIFGRRTLGHYDDERVLAVTRWLNGQVKRAGVTGTDLLRHFGFNKGSGQIGHWTAMSSGAQPAVPTMAQWASLKARLDLPDDMDGEVAAINAAKGAAIPRHLREATGGRWFTWPRGKHSEKPEAFLDLVEVVSPGPYVELFARRDRLGWDTWGNESLGTAQMGTA